MRFKHSKIFRTSSGCVSIFGKVSIPGGLSLCPAGIKPIVACKTTIGRFEGLPDGGKSLPHRYPLPKRDSGNGDSLSPGLQRTDMKPQMLFLMPQVLIHSKYPV